jgi:hypothetical protein
MEFEKRLERAIDRGRHARETIGRKQTEQSISEEDLKNLHSRCRIDLSEHIESCLRKVADAFPGFRFETVVGEEGWGARLSRDDFRGGRDAANTYSRLEMLVRPFSTAHIVELTVKATVRNKEVFNRSHYQFLSQMDAESFTELIDRWVREYVERYAASE